VADARAPSSPLAVAKNAPWLTARAAAAAVRRRCLRAEARHPQLMFQPQEAAAGPAVPDWTAWLQTAAAVHPAQARAAHCQRQLA